MVDLLIVGSGLKRMKKMNEKHANYIIALSILLIVFTGYFMYKMLDIIVEMEFGDDNCCHTSFCEKMFREIEKYAKEKHGVIICSQLSCVDMCERYIKEKNMTWFDCFAICPDSRTNKCPTNNPYGG